MLNKIQKSIAGYKIDSLEQLVFDLTAKLHSEDAAPAWVSLHTSDGFVFCGFLLALRHARHQSFAVLQSDAAAKEFSDDVTFIPLDRLTAVRVHASQKCHSSLIGNLPQLSPPLPNQGVNHMGLREKRAVTTFQDQIYPGLQHRITESLSFDVPVEIEWDSLAVENCDHLYAEAFPKVYFEPMIQAFAAITVDDMGRQALKGSLKKIVVKNRGGFTNPSGISFENGMLLIDHESCTNVHDISERSQAIQAALERGL